MASSSYNPHHRRMWKNGHGALKYLGQVITDAEADPSNTSQEVNDKATQAYILVQDIVNGLDERRREHNQAAAEARIALRNAPVVNTKEN